MENSLTSFRRKTNARFYQESGTTFVYDPKLHDGSTVMFTPTAGEVELDLIKMGQGDTLKLVLTEDTMITEKQDLLYPTAINKVGVVTMTMINGMVYADALEDVTVALAAAEAVVQEEGTPVLPVAATLTTDDAVADAALLWTAKTKGASGNDLDILFSVGETTLSVVPTGGATAELIFTGAKGSHPISITYAEGDANNEVSVAVLAGDITVTLGTEATALGLYEKLTDGSGATAIAPLIKTIKKGASWSDVVFVGTAAQDYLDSAATSVTVVGDVIEVECEYDGATDAITSTATEVIALIEADTPGANDLVSVVATGTGAKPVVEMAAAESLTGGVDGTPAAKGKILFDDNGAYISVDASTVAVSNWRGLAYTYPPTLVDTTTDNTYAVLGTDSHVVVTASTAGNADTITLPEATGSGRSITISNQDDTSDVVITPDGSDTIDNAANLTLGEKESCTLVDYAVGKWLIK